MLPTKFSFFKLGIRRSIVSQKGDLSFFQYILALLYFAFNRTDIALLFILFSFAKRQKSLLTPLLKRLASNQGLIDSYVNGLNSSMVAKDCKKNPYYRGAIDQLPISIFIGVNQSGSWSFREAISSALGFDESFSIEDYSTATNFNQIPTIDLELEHLRKIIDGINKKPRFIYSHRGIPLHLALTNESFSYSTMLRNPISRVVASYFWSLKYRDLNFHWVPEIIKCGASLADYIDFMHDSGWRPGGNRTGEYFFDAWLSQGLIPKNCSMSRIKGADYILGKYFEFIGITELFDESLFIFSKNINLNRLPTWCLRGNSGRPSLADISPEILRKIDRLTEDEQMLYQKHRDCFESQYVDEIKYFRRKVGSLRISD